MRHLWTTYAVSKEAPKDAGRVGIAVLASKSAVENLYPDFSKGHETVLVDLSGMFIVPDVYLEPEAPCVASFVLRTAMGTAHYAKGITNQDTETPEGAILNYAVSGYSYLLPVNAMRTMADFAGLIEKQYSMQEPRNKAVVDLLRSIAP